MGFGFPVAIYPEPAPLVGMWVINYEKLISSAFDTIYEQLRFRKFYMVADESHRIKNFKAKVTKSAIYLFDHATVKRVMTGTPVANNVVDLWSQLRAIGCHGAHRSPYTFRNRYGVMGGWMGKQVIGTQREDELEGILADNSFRAKKKDWMKHLPPKAYYVLNYDMNPAQKRWYSTILKDKVIITDTNEITAQMVITALMKAQQVTSGFMIDDAGQVVDLCPKVNPKIDAIVEALEDISGKALVFAHYQHTVNLLEAALGAYKPLVIRGGMRREDVKAIVDQFNQTDVKVLIAQTATAKEGLTLLGTETMNCSTTFYAENTYSIIDRTQSEDRNHRHGQTADQVSYYDMVGSAIESKIIKALQEKGDLVKMVMEVVRHG
jgi:SNF2 family DNA or RNA helicase